MAPSLCLRRYPYLQFASSFLWAIRLCKSNISGLFGAVEGVLGVMEGWLNHESGQLINSAPQGVNQDDSVQSRLGCTWTLYFPCFTYNCPTSSGFDSSFSQNERRGHNRRLRLCEDESLLTRNGMSLWQQGPASFNITAKTDVCTLPINMPKLIIVYVT